MFRDCHSFTAAIPSYAGGIMAFGWATEDPELRRQPLKTLQQRFSKSGIATRNYTPAIYRSVFALHQYIVDAIGKKSP